MILTDDGSTPVIDSNWVVTNAYYNDNGNLEIQLTHKNSNGNSSGGQSGTDRTSTNMLEDQTTAAEGGRVAADRDPESIDRLLASRGVKPIDFAGWKKVDAFERAEGAKEGREHKKVIDPEQMRALAHA